MLTVPLFAESLLSHCRVTTSDRLLVGVSGGADSMALLHLLLRDGMSVEAAHVNYCLRGDESDGDERFVIEQCQQWGVTLHRKRFETHQLAKERKQSVEMVARELRYQWFRELIASHSFAAVAVGHHLNDSVETVFINLLRGTGIHGMTGIKARMGHVVRPLLSFSRQEILDYCEQNHVPWRTDSSNLADDYLRNKIRHHVVPVLEGMNPSFLQTMSLNMARLQMVEDFMADALAQIKRDMVAEADGTLLIPIRLIDANPHKELVLYELLSPLGYSGSQVADVLASLNGIPGKQFLSATHRLVRDRHNLIVVSIEPADLGVQCYIESGQTECHEPISMTFCEFERTDGFEFSRDVLCVHLDGDKIDFPLTVRKWRQGDAFMPLGMDRFKKLSDFFIDTKLSMVEKERTWLLLAGEDIVWVIGQRIDNRFKVGPKTKKILEVRWEK